MAESVGSIKYEASIDTSQMRADASRAEGIARDTGDGISKGFGVVKAAASIAAVAITAATTAFGITAIKSASELQGMRASFESMTGSAENASKVLSSLNKFSFETAFSSAQINQSAQLLLGAGLEVEKLGGYMKAIGDVAGATGADLGQLTLPLSQALSRGKLQTQDFYQILNSGAGKLGQVLKQELADRGMGDFEKAMSDGKVTSDILFAAIEKSAAQGGFAFEGAIKQAGTFDGRLSNMQESLLGVGLGLLGVNKATGEVDPNGAFAKLSDGVKFIGDWVTAHKEEIMAFFMGFGGVMSQIGQVMDIVSQAWAWMMTQMQPVIDYIMGNQQLWEVLKLTLLAIAVIIGVTLVAAIAILITIIAIVGAAIQAAIWVVEKMILIFTWLGRKIYETVQSFWQFSSGVGQAIAGAIGWVASLPGKVLGALGNIGSTLYNSGKSLIDGFTNGIKDAFNSAKKAVADGMKNVRDFFPFSPAKTGPFSGRGYTTYSGAALVKGFAAGMSGQAGLLMDTTSGLLSGVESSLGSGMVSGSGLSLNTPTGTFDSVEGSGAPGAAVQQINHIHNDIDLKAASQELAYQMDRGRS